jgi:hypothetical protein
MRSFAPNRVANMAHRRTGAAFLSALSVLVGLGGALLSPPRSCAGEGEDKTTRTEETKKEAPEDSDEAPKPVQGIIRIFERIGHEVGEGVSKAGKTAESAVNAAAKEAQGLQDSKEQPEKDVQNH